MSHRRARKVSLASLAAAAVLGLTLVGSPPAQAGGDHGGGSKDPTVIAKGLNNPRQLSFTRSGDLLVAEAGSGGSGPCFAGPEGGRVCFGATGSITKIGAWGKQSRIITGLPSLGGEGTGEQAIGPSDVAAEGKAVTVLIGLGADPAVRTAPGMPALAKRMGTLVQTTKHGGLRTIADVSAFEAANNPVPPADAPDSDPVGLLVQKGHYVVADAGGNDVLTVSRRGRIRLVSTFATTSVEFPPGSGEHVDMQAVPTSVAVKGRDGAYYVSQLTGFPFPKGAANIYRVDPRTGVKSVYAAGLTNVTDLAFHGHTLYAVQISSEGLLTGPTGSLVQVKRGGTTPDDHAVVAGGLFAPYGIAIKGNSAYLTTGAVAPGAGQVIKVRL